MKCKIASCSLLKSATDADMFETNIFVEWLIQIQFLNGQFPVFSHSSLWAVQSTEIFRASKNTFICLARNISSSLESLYVFLLTDTHRSIAVCEYLPGSIFLTLGGLFRQSGNLCNFDPTHGANIINHAE